MRKTIVIFMVIMLFSLTLVQAGMEETLKVHLSGLESQVKGKLITGSAGSLFGNQGINLLINFENGESHNIAIITKNKAVKTIQLAEIENPTLKIEVSEVAIRTIQEADEPMVEIQRALRIGTLKYETVGFMNNLKFTMFSSYSNFRGLFTDDPEVIVKKDTEVEETDEKAEQETEKEEVDNVDKEIESGGLLTGGTVAQIIEEPKLEEDDGIHTVLLDNTGFEITEIDIKVGDTVMWVNGRTAHANKGMIIGVQRCVAIKSKIFENGESFSWTFDKAGTCVFVDGIYTTQSMKVNILE
jgi:plastocyanin